MKKLRHSRKYDDLLRTLRDVRKEARMTQSQVARKFGTHASFISKCESGERRIDVIELTEFCRHYGITVTEFLRRAGVD